MHNTKFQAKCPFGAGEAKRKTVQDGRHGGKFGFLIGKILPFFIYKSPRCFRLSFKSISLLVQETKRKVDIHDGRHGDHFGFPIGTILAFFDLPVTPMLLTKFRINLPICSGEEAKNRFSRLP